MGLRAENRRLLREMAKLEARIERAEQGREHAEQQNPQKEGRRQDSYADRTEHPSAHEIRSKLERPID